MKKISTLVIFLIILIVGSMLRASYVSAAPSAEEQVTHETHSLYQNDSFQCKMNLPLGWHNTSMTNDNNIYLYKSLPVFRDGKQTGAFIRIEQKLLKASMQTFNDLTSERLNEIKLNLMQSAIDKGLPVEGEIKDVEKHKVIWISISGKNKVYEVLFMEKGYLWDFTTTVPDEYSRAMDEELENLIRSFRMIEESEKIIEKPLTVLEWYWKGSKYESKHEYRKAIDVYSQAIKLYSKDASLYGGRASSYSALGEYELSLADYSKTIELDRLNFGYYHNRGNFYKKFKKYDLAIADYSRAIELNAGFFTRKARGNAYMMICQYELALADYDKMIEFWEGDPEGYFYKSQAYGLQGNYQFAIEICNVGLERRPLSPILLFNLGQAYELLGKKEEAIDFYQRAINKELKQIHEKQKEMITSKVNARLNGDWDSYKTWISYIP